MSVKTLGFANVWSQVQQILVIVINLELWVTPKNASARKQATTAHENSHQLSFISHAHSVPTMTK